MSSAVPWFLLLTIALSGAASGLIFLWKRRRPVVVVAVHPVSGAKLEVTRYTYVAAYWVGALGAGASLLFAAWYYTNGFVMAIVFLFLSYALIAIGDDLPVWVRRCYHIGLRDGAVCRFTVWGGEWDRKKLMWWDDECGMWVHHIRDNSDSVQHIALDQELLRTLDGGTYKWNAPFADDNDYRLDDRFCETNRNAEPLVM
jgi:hypothetical protein